VAVGLTDALANALKQNMSEIAIAPYADGRFEVIVDGETMWSKLETGDFPDDATLVKQIVKMAAGA
jgi:selT/selW/selH-like putative selenoprotein